MSQPRTFKDRLRVKMAEHNLTQQQLGKEIQISQPTVSRLLTGVMPDAIVSLRLSKLFGCSVEWLITGTDSPPAPRTATAQHVEDLSVAKDALNGPLNDGNRIWAWAGVLESIAETNPQVAAAMRRAADIASQRPAPTAQA